MRVSDGTRSAEYGYLADSRLVETITHETNSVAIASYSYDYNTANQRVKVAEVDGSYWICEHDALGQVKSGKKYWSDGTIVVG